jgi:hypothetical protein
LNSESRLGVPDVQKREHGKNMLTPSVRRPLPLPSVTPIDPQAVHAGVEEDLAALLDRDRGDFPVGHQDDAAGAHAFPQVSTYAATPVQRAAVRDLPYPARNASNRSGRPTQASDKRTRSRTSGPGSLRFVSAETVSPTGRVALRGGRRPGRCRIAAAHGVAFPIQGRDEDHTLLAAAWWGPGDGAGIGPYEELEAMFPAGGRQQARPSPTWRSCRRSTASTSASCLRRSSSRRARRGSGLVSPWAREALMRRCSVPSQGWRRPGLRCSARSPTSVLQPRLTGRDRLTGERLPHTRRLRPAPDQLTNHRLSTSPALQAAPYSEPRSSWDSPYPVPPPTTGRSRTIYSPTVGSKIPIES